MGDVCWESVATSTWMQRRGKPTDTILAALPRMRTCILVAMSGLGLEIPKLEKGVCTFPKKIWSCGGDFL